MSGVSTGQRRIRPPLRQLGRHPHRRGEQQPGRRPEPRATHREAAKLRKAYNPNKPIKIAALGIGNQTDKTALAQLGSATNGLSYQALTPTDVANVFIDAYLKRG